jgi:heme-degrading monooxygenase HmoA
MPRRDLAVARHWTGPFVSALTEFLARFPADREDWPDTSPPNARRHERDVEYIRYTIDDARAEAFEQGYRQAAEALESSEHCERYEVSRCSADPIQHVVRIEWDSEQRHRSGFRQSPSSAASSKP